MLKEENELLTRVGPGTPMGDLLRQYWIPALLSSELPEPDGPPLRVRFLGEDLIAFRDTLGRVGFLGDHCSHRGASLFFGRNEECGLRCVYHGWKYDVAGKCVDMPNEPAFRWTDSGGRDSAESSSLEAQASSFREKIRHLAYPCAEQGGVIWTYMGPRSAPPELPMLEWALVPEDRRILSPVLRECNWVQALEGDIDTAHLYFLHSRLNPAQDGGARSGTVGVYHEDLRPRLELVETDYGLVYGARRQEGPDSYYWRITQFAFPFHTFFPPGGQSGVPGHIWVPLDDHNTMVWSVYWDPLAPMVGRGNQQRGGGNYLPPTSDALGRRRPLTNKGNDYLVDREVQRTQTFTGIPNIAAQDQAMTESMGPIYDRSQEHLGTTDAAIVQVRRRLLNAARALRESGVTPPCADDPSLYGIRSASLVLPRDVDWQEAAREYLRAFTDLPVATV